MEPGQDRYAQVRVCACVGGMGVCVGWGVVRCVGCVCGGGG